MLKVWHSHHSGVDLGALVLPDRAAPAEGNPLRSERAVPAWRDRQAEGVARPDLRVAEPAGDPDGRREPAPANGEPPQGGGIAPPPAFGPPGHPGSARPRTAPPPTVVAPPA